MGKVSDFFNCAFKGKLLLRMGVERYLGQIVFFFVMSLLFIWVNLQIEGTVHQMQYNKKTLENMKSVHTEMTCSLTGLNSVCKVDKMLEGMGSQVTLPGKKAKKLY